MEPSRLYYYNINMANGMKMWKRNGNTTALLFFLKGFEILHQERRGQVKTIVMEHFNGILFHESGLANKQHTNHSLKQLNLLGNCDICVRTIFWNLEDKFPFKNK